MTKFLLAAGIPALIVSTATVEAATYATTVNAQLPLAYYRFGDLSDEVGGGGLTKNAVTLPATTTPALTPANGFDGFVAGNTWATFDGTPGSTLTTVNTSWTSTAGTISYWIRPAGTGSGTQTGVFARQSDGSGVFDGAGANFLGTFARNNGSMGLSMDGDQIDASAGTIPIGQWSHVAFTWERNTGSADGIMRAYLNGSEVAGKTDASIAAFNIDAARFGKEVGGATRQLQGSADELAIWSRALTPAEVLTQSNAGTVPEPAALGLLSLGTLAFLARRRRA